MGEKRAKRERVGEREGESDRKREGRWKERDTVEREEGERCRGVSCKY